MIKKILLTGGTSLFGAAFLKKIPKDYLIFLIENKNPIEINNKKVIKKKADIRDKKMINKILSETSPDLIIHGAAIGNVDYCEKNQQEAWQVNVEGTKNIINGLKNKKTSVIYLSTNAVFNGKKDIYKEEDKPHPINFYGKTKFASEKLVQKSGLPWIIVRPMTMFGWPPKGARPNPVTWVLENLTQKLPLKVVDDVYLNPLYNYDLAKVMWMIITSRKTGVFHVGGAEVLNRYQWALKVAEVFRLDKKLVTPVSSSFFSGKIANRPAKTIYSIEKIRKTFKFLPKNISQALKEMKMNKNPQVTNRH